MPERMPEMSPEDRARTLDVLQHHWGYDALRPMQQEAVAAGLLGRDSLLVMPTGGGKSLCYQLPPLVAGRVDIVVSPLIALMEDQIASLRSVGVEAAAMHSGLSNQAHHEVLDGIRDGRWSLLFCAPERVVDPRWIEVMRAMRIGAIAIDEAHCISDWGHDFRPEYRQLAGLRKHFPGVSMHAFTATATPKVRDDIIRQLGLVDPVELVGHFDRPNLVYRILPKDGATDRIASTLDRHRGEGAIVYCRSRSETERYAESLRKRGLDAGHYHAGMDASTRERVQRAFKDERLDVVCATVAFGMGIDRSNVRCVIHASLPASIEQYQQETGRAGRDGLEAECVLLYSAGDVVRWKEFIDREAQESGDEANASRRHHHLTAMQAYARTIRCRHRTLVEHFGQELETNAETGCGACDVCLGEVVALPGSTLIARKILSAVARVEQSFGIGHVVKVLRGVMDESVQRRGHHELSVFGLLADHTAKGLTNLVHQCVDLGLLERTPGDRPVVRLTEEGMAAMKGRLEVQFTRPPEGTSTRRTKADTADWEGVDRSLFERLREWRKTVAASEGVPPYVVFGDRTLRALAKAKPTELGALLEVSGIGAAKSQKYGESVLSVVSDAIRASAKS